MSREEEGACPVGHCAELGATAEHSEPHAPFAAGGKCSVVCQRQKGFRGKIQKTENAVAALREEEDGAHL